MPCALSTCPRNIELAADGLGAFVLAGVVVLGVALFRPRLKHERMPEGGWRKRWFVLQEDLALIGHSWYLWAALLATVPYLLLQVVPGLHSVPGVQIRSVVWDCAGADDADPSGGSVTAGPRDLGVVSIADAGVSGTRLRHSFRRVRAFFPGPLGGDQDPDSDFGCHCGGSDGDEAQ